MKKKMSVPPEAGEADPAKQLSVLLPDSRCERPTSRTIARRGHSAPSSGPIISFSGSFEGLVPLPTK